MDEKTLAGLKEMEALAGNVSDLKRIVRLGLFSDPGIGKTTLAAIIAAMLSEKSCLITTDQNWTVINKFPEIAARIKRYPFMSMNQVKSIIEAHDEGIEPYASYGTITFDTYSTMANKYLRSIVKKKKYNDQRDPDVPGRTHYGLLSNAVKDCIFDPLQNSNINAIFLTHVKDPSEDEINKKRLYIRSNLPNATWEPMIQEVQAFGWLYRETSGSKVLAQFEPTVTVMAKSQIPTIEQKKYPADELPSLIEKWIKG